MILFKYVLKSHVRKRQQNTVEVLIKVKMLTGYFIELVLRMLMAV